jgi:hypothetical protein
VRQLADLEGVHVKADRFENVAEIEIRVSVAFLQRPTGRASAVFQPMSVRERPPLGRDGQDTAISHSYYLEGDWDGKNDCAIFKNRKFPSHFATSRLSFI